MPGREGTDRRIEFVRPDPTKFVLLVCRTGRGTGVVAGTENFKPGGTEWATDQDLRDAGYVPAHEVIAALRELALDMPGQERDRALGRALNRLGLRP